MEGLLRFLTAGFSDSHYSTFTAQNNKIFIRSKEPSLEKQSQASAERIHYFFTKKNVGLEIQGFMVRY